LGVLRLHGALKQLFSFIRTIFILLLVGALVFVGWKFRDRYSFLFPRGAKPAPTAETAESFPPTQPDPSPAELNTPPAVPPDPFQTPDIPAPTTSPLAPPGTFYLLQRVSRQTETGIKAARAGTEVRLMYRHKNGTMLVTDGSNEFLVKPAAVTRDRGLADRAMSP
jgi:hypothetical protein